MERSNPKGKATSPFFLLLILALALFVYLRSLDNGFIFDDRALTVANGAVTAPSFDAIIHSYRPLRTASYALDHALFGSSPAAFRAMNIFYHMLASILVFLFISSLSRHRVAAFTATALFAMHPLQTDAVAYIAGRRDVLAALFFLGSLTAFVRYLRRGEKAMLLLSFAAFVCSFLSKETGAMIPLVMMILLGFWGDKMPVGRKRSLWLFFLFILTVALLMAITGGGSALLSGVSIKFHGDNPSTHYLTATTLFPYYLKQTLFPLQLIMDNANYPLVRAVGPKLFLSLSVLVLYFAIMIMLYVKKYIRIAFYMFFFLASLAPVLQIIPLHEIAADHYLYLPLVGFCGIAGELVVFAVHWVKGRRHLLAAFSIIVCVGCALPLYAAKTTSRIGELSDIYTVLLSDHKWRPISFRGQYTIGAFYLETGFPDIAYRYYREAWSSGYHDASLLGNLINYHIVKGDHPRAIDNFEELDRRKEPVSDASFMNMITLYVIRGDCRAAENLLARIPNVVENMSHKRLVEQCGRYLQTSSIPEKIDMLHEAGVSIETRPLYEELITTPDMPKPERDRRVVAYVSILGKYDLPAAERILRDLPAGSRQDDLRHTLEKKKQQVRTVCDWMSTVLRNGFCSSLDGTLGSSR